MLIRKDEFNVNCLTGTGVARESVKASFHRLWRYRLFDDTSIGIPPGRIELPVPAMEMERKVDKRVD